VRKDLLRVSQQTDPNVARLQDDLRDALTILSSDDDVLRAPVLSLVATGAVPQGTSVVVFSGRTAQSISLPAANSQGANVSVLVLILNTSTSAVTIYPSGADKIKGLAAMTVAAGVVSLLASDGVSKWLGLP
jgi:hypothetical protein